MAIAGALAGLAGIAQVSGTEKYLSGGVAASIGFDAITVALLGRSTPWGTFFAGLLFGAFRAGGVAMQAQTQTPIDIVLVIQSLIVLFIAAPPLVRAIFGLNPRKKRKPKEPSAAGHYRARHLQRCERSPRMSTTIDRPAPAPARHPDQAAAELVSWKAGIGFSVLAILGTILFGLLANGEVRRVPDRRLGEHPGFRSRRLGDPADRDRRHRMAGLSLGGPDPRRNPGGALDPRRHRRRRRRPGPGRPRRGPGAEGHAALRRRRLDLRRRAAGAGRLLRAPHAAEAEDPAAGPVRCSPSCSWSGSWSGSLPAAGTRSRPFRWPG